uniref:MTM0441 n=1 Tax=Volvox carteri f. nagariensis TaxID=3068 RepID=D9CJ62_VOLCA|nr:MTM0441 [Volvox carteri f. nagariensis]
MLCTIFCRTRREVNNFSSRLLHSSNSMRSNPSNCNNYSCSNTCKVFFGKSNNSNMSAVYMAGKVTGLEQRPMLLPTDLQQPLPAMGRGPPKMEKRQVADVVGGEAVLLAVSVGAGGVHLGR